MAVFFAFLFSCEPANLQPHSDLKQSKDIEVIDGILHFESFDDFNATIDILLEMRDEELENWESNLGFKSFRSIYWDASEKFHTLSSESQYSNWMEEYKDILYLDQDEYKPKSPVFIYQTVANREGIFYVDGILFKSWKDKLIKINDGDINKLVLATTLETSSIENGITITKYSGNQIINLRDEGDCYTDQTGAIDYFERNGDRRAYIKIETIPYPYGPIGGGYVSLVTLRVYGYKKGIFGGFNLYSTHLACDQVSFRLIDHEGIARTVNNYSKTQNYNSKNLYKKWYLGNSVVPNPNTTLPYFEWVKGRGVTSGTGDNGWAVVCCNVEFPDWDCPDSSGADPFP